MRRLALALLILGPLLSTSTLSCGPGRAGRSNTGVQEPPPVCPLPARPTSPGELTTVKPGPEGVVLTWEGARALADYLGAVRRWSDVAMACLRSGAVVP